MNCRWGRKEMFALAWMQIPIFISERQRFGEEDEEMSRIGKLLVARWWRSLSSILFFLPTPSSSFSPYTSSPPLTPSWVPPKSFVNHSWPNFILPLQTSLCKSCVFYCFLTPFRFLLLSLAFSTALYTLCLCLLPPMLDTPALRSLISFLLYATLNESQLT